MSELRKDIELAQDELVRERDQCRLLVNAEKHDAEAAKDKLTAQMTQLKTAAEQVTHFKILCIFLFIGQLIQQIYDSFF